MNVKQWANLTEDFGRSDFGKTPPRASKSQKWLITALICSFVLLAFAADLWPCKKTYFWFTNFGVRCLNAQISPALRYTPGLSGREEFSLAYLALLKIFQGLIPSRLFCLRAVSILAAGVGLVFLYRMFVVLFCRPVGLIFIFLLVTSPIYIESMRAFGFRSLTHLVAALTCYFLAISLNNRRTVVKIALLSFFCLLTLSLYVIGRLAILLPVVFFGLYFKKDWRKLLLFFLFFIGYIVILDLNLGDVRFNPGDFLFGPEYGDAGQLKTEEALISGEKRKQLLLSDFSAEWLRTKGGSFNRQVLRNRLMRNLGAAVDYLINRDRKSFSDEDRRSRLFDLAYTPFLLLGFLICAWKRGKSNVFLLVPFLLFFGAPLFSSHVNPRRVLLALPSIYLLIALGLWFGFKLLSGFNPSRVYRLTLVYCSVAFLAVIGVCFYSRWPGRIIIMSVNSLKP